MKRVIDCKKILIDIFITFFKIGLFTFGGGYAMIPLIEEEIVNKKEWLNSDELIELLTLSESVPGSVSINSATMIGHKLARRAGSLVAVLGVVLPSYIVILVISIFSRIFYGNEIIKAALIGVRCAVVALIVKSAISFIRSCSKDIISNILFFSTIVITLLGIHSILTIVLGAAVSLVLGHNDVNKWIG